MSKTFISNKDETIRMFQSDFLEAFSRVHFTVPLILFGPVVLYFLYQAWTLTTIGLMLGWLGAGLLTWTFTEYTLHRFLFHFTIDAAWFQRLHFIMHGVHHDYPNDSKRLVMPPVLSIPLAVAFYFLFRWMVPASGHSSHFAGFLTGYLIYDMTHYAVHHFNMHSRVWLAVKNHHMKHHFMDPTSGFGVSSPLWDFLLGTTFRTRNKRETVEENAEA